MVNAILGKKLTQSQKSLEDGTRVPVTTIWAGENYVVRTMGSRMQLGFDTKKHSTKPIEGILKKAGIDKNLRFFREIAPLRAPLADSAGQATNGKELKAGQAIAVQEVLKPGDRVQVMGISKGKGFAGVVKRHHFRGGPRTHGQSDRERAPGSIGQTTTPGRVYKGKRMAGRMGQDRVTVKNLVVLSVSDDIVTIKGLVPGGRNSLLLITKAGEAKKFVPLYQEKKVDEVEEVEKVEEEKEAKVEAEAQAAPVEEPKIEEPKAEAKVEVKDAS